MSGVLFPKKNYNLYVPPTRMSWPVQFVQSVSSVVGGNTVTSTMPNVREIDPLTSLSTHWSVSLNTIGVTRSKLEREKNRQTRPYAFYGELECDEVDPAWNNDWSVGHSWIYPITGGGKSKTLQLLRWLSASSSDPSQLIKTSVHLSKGLVEVHPQALRLGRNPF